MDTVSRAARATRPAPPSYPEVVVSPALPAPVLTIDALGLKCPIPIIMLAERIGQVPIGQTVAVLADDPAARSDLPSWCVMKAQELLAVADLPKGWAFLIRRRC